MRAMPRAVTAILWTAFLEKAVPGRVNLADVSESTIRHRRQRPTAPRRPEQEANSRLAQGKAAWGPPLVSYSERRVESLTIGEELIYRLQGVAWLTAAFRQTQRLSIHWPSSSN